MRNSERLPGLSRLLLASTMPVHTPNDIIIRYADVLYPLVATAVSAGGTDIPLSTRDLHSWIQVRDSVYGARHDLAVQEDHAEDAEAAYFPNTNVLVVYAKPVVAEVTKRLQNLRSHTSGNTLGDAQIREELHRYLSSALAHEWQHARDVRDGAKDIGGASWTSPSELAALTSQIEGEFRRGVEDYAMPYQLDRMINSLSRPGRKLTTEEVKALAALEIMLKAKGVHSPAIAAGFKRVLDR